MDGQLSSDAGATFQFLSSTSPAKRLRDAVKWREKRFLRTRATREALQRQLT